MESFIINLAVTLVAAAIVAVVGSAFARPKLFLQLYPHAMVACGVATVFSAGLFTGKPAAAVFGVGAAGAMSALILWMVLQPIAVQKAAQEDRKRQD